MKCVYPPLNIKVVTQAFVCPELCLFQLRANLPGCYSQWPHHLSGRLPSQTGADSNFLGCQKGFHNNLGNGHSSNISSANAGLPKGWEKGHGKMVLKAPHESPDEPSDRMFYSGEWWKENLLRICVLSDYVESVLTWHLALLKQDSPVTT